MFFEQYSLNNAMKLDSTLSSYPLFPDWVFEGELQIDNTVTNAVLSEVQVSKTTQYFHNTNFGWITNKNVTLGKNIAKLNSLIGNMFVENAGPHFRIRKQNWTDIEICETWTMGITPTHNYPQSLHRHRWYHSVLFLKAQDKSSNLYFDQYGPKLYSCPPRVQSHEHIVPAKTNKIVFFPAHIPWGFTPNNSDQDCVICCNSFVIKQ